MKRIAIIGLGAVTGNIHLPAYSKLKDKVSVVAGCDIDAACRSVATEKWHIPEVFDNPRQMLEKTDPDIVCVCTPPSLHREQVIAALESGCHVFCEKPLAPDLAEIDAIIEASIRSKRLVVVNNQFPFMNIHTEAKKYIGTQEFGRLLYLHAWQTFIPTDATEAGWRAEMKRRVCFEFGIHVFDLIRFFFGQEPSWIFAHQPQPKADIISDAINFITMEFEDGRSASIILDRLSKGPEQYLNMRLDGENASIQTSIGGELNFQLGMHTKQRQPFAAFNLVKGGKAILQNGIKSKIIAKDGINPFASATAVHFNNFIEAIKNDTIPPGTAQDNRNSLALVFASGDSAQAHKPVQVSPYLNKTKHNHGT